MQKTLFLLVSYLIFNSFQVIAQHNDCKKDYFSTPKRVEKLKPMFTFMDLKSGSIVASIGAKNGWFEAAASIYHDSLTFYLEDIDTECLNESSVNATIALYAKIKKQPIRNRFERVVGTDSTTGLLTQFFDRVLINNAFHHFSKKKQMLNDIKRIIKTDGFLYVFEPIILEKQAKSFKCKYYTSEKSLISEIEMAGFLFVEKYQFGEGSLFFKFENKRF
jgi:ubiquinone/menaquinone biosynthesis C-methylase UbiE